MSLITDLKTITPKYGHKVCRGSVDIHEHEAKATVTKVTWSNSDFNCIDTQMIKDSTSFFEICKAPDIFRKDCDGIVLFEHAGKKYMFLTELKSGFSTQFLYKAKTQLVASFIKANMLLHMLPSYQQEDYIVKGFIVSHSPTDDFLTTLHQATSLPYNSRQRQEYNLAIRLLIDNRKTKSTTLRAADFTCIHSLPLGQRGIFPKMDLHFIEVPSDQSSITLDIHDYI